MPYARCPVCNDSFHLKVKGDPREWERQHVGERTVDGTPLLKCIRCWVELRPGHQVTVRTSPSKFSSSPSIGQHGVVELDASEAGGKVTVRFGESLIKFRREELFYVVGQPPLA